MRANRAYRLDSPTEVCVVLRMVIPGAFAVMGLLLLAGHLARPGILRRLVSADTNLWWFLPWVTDDILDVEGRYQRTYRRFAVLSVSGWTVTNLALFAAPYATSVVSFLGRFPAP